MKSIILTLFISSTYFISAQDLEQIPFESMQWHYSVQSIIDTDVTEYMTELNAGGETVDINDITYTKIYASNGGVIGSVRNDNNRVYYIPEGAGAELQTVNVSTETVETTTELLLYDFAVETGDTISGIYQLRSEAQGIATYNLIDLRVDQIEIVTINGYERKELYLSDVNSSGSYHHRWIEGIGSTGSFFHTPAPEQALGGTYASLMCTASFTNLIYGDLDPFSYCGLFFDNISEQVSPSDITIYPNPSNGEFIISVDRINTQISSNDITIYNFLGESIVPQIDVYDRKVFVHLEDYPIGVYSVNLDLGHQIITNKIVKK